METTKEPHRALIQAAQRFLRDSGYHTRSALVQYGGGNNGYFSAETWELVDADVVQILKQPVSVSISTNQFVSFSVTARGKPLLHYQWRKDGTNLADDGGISGATQGTLTNASPAADLGFYDVMILGDCGPATSTPAQLQLISNRPVLGLSFSANRWLLNWPSSNAVLETASVISGPWQTVPGASSPFLLSTNVPTAFFRLRQP